MLSRIIRHPAGLMKQAWRRNFLSAPFARPHAAAQRPEYWTSRFSGPGLSLVVHGAAPTPGIPRAAVPAAEAAAAGAAPGAAGLPAGILPRQGGKAASYLSAAGGIRAGLP